MPRQFTTKWLAVALPLAALPMLLAWVQAQDLHRGPASNPHGT